MNKNLFGEEIPPPEPKTKKDGSKKRTYTKRLKFNPCIELYGEGPEDKRCKDCDLLFVKVYAKRYYKCSLRKNTNGIKTDHSPNWPTCGRFIQTIEEQKNDENLQSL